MPSTTLSPDVLPVIGTTYAPAPLLGPAVLFALGVWSLVVIGFYIWYLWSLSRLFPFIGLPSGHGWIPVWNQWQLVQRGGLPGWLVLLGFVPGLGIVVWVVSVIAIHRINVEHGKGGGFTVLGALLPPVWAMQLARSIEENGGGYAAMPVASGSYASPAGYAPHGAVPQAPAYAPQQTAPQPPAPQQTAPEPPAQPWQAPDAPQPQAAAPAPVAPAAPAEQPDALARLFAEPQEQPQSDGQPLPGSEWGFSRTTEGDYQRLAQEGYQQRPAPTLGVEEPVRPFAWPGIDESNPPPAPPAAPPAPPMPPVSSALPAPAIPPVPPAAALPSVPAPVVAPAPQPPQQESFTTHRPSIFDSNSASAPHADTETARSQAVAPAPAAPEVVAAAAAEAGPAPDDDELDRTIVVPRPSRWGLELPDGDVLELRGDDVVVGRKPEAKNGSTVLQIADPTRTLSKSHARLRRVDGLWTIEDLDSTNGVALVDELGEQVPLEAGRENPVTERLVLGTLEVTLRRVS